MRLVLFYIMLVPFIVSANAQELKLILPLGHQGDVNSCVYSPDGKYMVTASNDKTAKVWEVLSGNLIFDLKGHGSYVTFATFSPDQKNILTACYDGVVRIWNFLNGELIRELSVG